MISVPTGSASKHCVRHCSLHKTPHSFLEKTIVADALAMPVHWYYNPLDIEKDFPGGIRTMMAAPERHPSSIMAVHSVSHGGRKTGAVSEPRRQVVGEVILKGKAQFWG